MKTIDGVIDEDTKVSLESIGDGDEKRGGGGRFGPDALKRLAQREEEGDTSKQVENEWTVMHRMDRQRRRQQ